MICQEILPALAQISDVVLILVAPSALALERVIVTLQVAGAAIQMGIEMHSQGLSLTGAAAQVPSASCAAHTTSYVASLSAGSYSTGPTASNSGFSCLTNSGAYSSSNTWVGNLAEAKAKCKADAECTALHNVDAGGIDWRACKSVAFLVRGPAATMMKGACC